MKLSTRLLILIPTVILAILAVQTWLAWRSDAELAKSSTERLLARDLLAAARTGAAFLDGNAHARVSLERDATKQEWLDLRATLAIIAERNGLTYEHCYTFAQPSADLSKLHWAVMLHPQPFVGDAYDVPPQNRALIKELVDTKQAVATRVYRDDHGEWLSALAPILTPNGDLAGILQMDYTAAEVSAQVTEQLATRRHRVLLQMVAITAIALAVLTVAVWLWLVLPLREISDFAEAVARGDHPERLRLRGSGELALLSSSLNMLDERLSDITKKARTTSELVTRLTTKLAESSRKLSTDTGVQARAAEETSGFVVKVDRSSQSVAHGSSKVTNLVIETTASIEEMMAQVSEIDRSAASLGSSTNVTASAIQQMGANIAEVAQNADSLTEQVSDAAVAVEEMRRSIVNVERSGRDLLTGAEATSSAVAGAMDSIRDVESSAQQSEKLALVVVADAENGRARVRSTIEGMDAIVTSIGEVVEVISHLEESSLAIGEILDLIEKVAEQTNVLALNAALIAAHAGEQGKAFGVVASKIRELSASTSERTKDIAKLVHSVRGDVSQATAVAQRAQRAAERGASFAAEAGVALDKILASAREASQLSQGIATSTVSQLLLGVQIAEAMDRVKRLIADISRATDEEGKAATRLVGTMESVREKANLFKRATVELRTGSVQIVSAIDNVATQVKEISRATDEQARGGKAIARAVAEMERAALDLTNAASSQSKESKQAVNAVVEISEVAQRNSEQVKSIDLAVSELLGESQKLLRDVSALSL